MFAKVVRHPFLAIDAFIYFSLYSPSQVADEDTPMSVASPHDSTVADPSMFTDALDSSSLSSDPASHESFEDLASDGMASPTLHEGGSSAHGRRTRAERLGSAPPPPVLGKRPAGKSPFAYPQILDTTSSVESDSPELEDVDEPEEQEKEVESDDDFELSDAADESDDDYVDDAPSPRRAKASGSRGQTGRSSPKSAKRGKSKASSTSNLGAPLDFLRFCQAAYCGISLNGTKCMACPAMKTRKRGKRCDVDGVHKNMRRHVQDQHTAVLCAMHHTGYVEPGGMLMMVLLLTPSIKEALEERPNPTVAAQIKTLEQMYGDWDPTNKTFDGFEVFDYHDDRWSVLAGRVELAIAKVDCDKCICRDKVFSRPDACLRHVKKANKRPGQEGLHAAIKGPIGERSVPQEEPVEPIPKKRKVERVPAKKGKRGVKRR